jgi:hypothetical protein
LEYESLHLHIQRFVYRDINIEFDNTKLMSLQSLLERFRLDFHYCYHIKGS